MTRWLCGFMCLICIFSHGFIQTYVWDHAFSLLHPTDRILLKTTNILSKVKFYGNNEIFALDHLYWFHNKCLSHDIFYQGPLCSLFSKTFKGWIKTWFDVFTIGSIHSWEQFMELFIIAHHNYKYDQLCDEIEFI